ncbi:MAG: hypothetical protein WCG25_08815 [bacterium]
MESVFKFIFVSLLGFHRLFIRYCSHLGSIFSAITAFLSFHKGSNSVGVAIIVVTTSLTAF